MAVVTLDVVSDEEHLLSKLEIEREVSLFEYDSKKLHEFLKTFLSNRVPSQQRGVG